MIDLHTHTFFSDGELGLAELARRAEVAGYEVIGVTDHADGANLELLLPRLVAAARELDGAMRIRVLAGVELTHVPPRMIPAMITRARQLGAQYVVVHGETITEPTAEGTNAAAIDGGADILAHPGLLSLEDAQRAAARGVLLEITTRKGHAYTNGHVVTVARAAGARLVINNDAHDPADLVGPTQARRIARGAGLSDGEIDACLRTAHEFVARLISTA
ncbi:MAG: histidinol phosphate phosphatase domain-containing protein [bacterium]|nr:histidinol phosphate phosphatase domain-containing protein [bacterium]